MTDQFLVSTDRSSKDLTGAEKPDFQNPSSLTGLDPTSDDTIELSSTEYTIVIICLILALTLGALDQSIYAVAVLAISSEFSGLQDINWISTAYFLTTTAFMPLY
ncbi:hypothetical protein HDU99_007055, partial [Rhizoclosmatium hyalinum]